MKKIFSLFFLLSFNVFSQEIPTTPPNPCYGGCNAFQNKLVKEFTKSGTLPEKRPAVYSGVCHHAGLYDPDVEHHSVVLLDETEGKTMFSAIFSFFEGYNAFENWTVDIARKEMSPYWRDHGDVTAGDNTLRVVINDNEGYPVYFYWMRQNPRTKELLFITYMGAVNKAFCRLRQHPTL